MEFRSSISSKKNNIQTTIIGKGYKPDIMELNRLEREWITDIEGSVASVARSLETRTAYFDHVATLNSLALINAKLSNKQLKAIAQKLVEKTKNLESGMSKQAQTIDELTAKLAAYETLLERVKIIEERLEARETASDSGSASPESTHSEELPLQGEFVLLS